MVIKSISIDKLYNNNGQIKGLSTNPRQISTEDFLKLKKSIQDNPEMLELRELIVYPQDDYFIVIAGNMRLKAMKELEFTHATCKVLDKNTSLEKLKAYTIKDNISRGEWDFELLANDWEVDELIEFGLDLPVDFGAFENEDELDNENEDNIPEVLHEPKTKMGDVWILGKHRLMCGDSINIDNVDKLMNGNKANLGFCDPPYNLNFKYNKYEDNKTDEEYKEFSKTWFSNLKMFTERQIVTLGTKNITIMANLDNVVGVGCWVKKNWITSCKIANLQQWEPIFFYGDFLKYKRNSDLFEINRKIQQDVKDNHPCPKQIELMTDLFDNYSEKNQKILDLFGGSGSTLIACEKTKRINYSMELDPHYCDVIIKRWQDYTKKDAVLESTQQKFNDL